MNIHYAPNVTIHIELCCIKFAYYEVGIMNTISPLNVHTIILLPLATSYRRERESSFKV